MNGKEKCKLLKSIRKRIAYENDIDLEWGNADLKGTAAGPV